MKGQTALPTKIGILGYGNQGRAQALNLRDSGESVLIGARKGKGAEQAAQDGFEVVGFSELAERVETLVFLLPDPVIPQIYTELLPQLKARPYRVGFSHGYAIHYKKVERLEKARYFLAAPKGAGAILRKAFKSGSGLPVAFATLAKDTELEAFAKNYCKKIGALGEPLRTTFAEETECDLFGEQAVLCGGLMELMEQAHAILVENGHSSEMAFLETCYEAQRILELFMQYGPKGMADRISPTAFYGGLTRGKRLIDPGVKKKLNVFFEEIRSGRFTEEWESEVKQGMPILREAKERVRDSSLQAAFEKLQPILGDNG